MSAHEIVHLLQVNAPALVFIGLGAMLFLIAVRALICDLTGRDALTRKEMSGDDVLPMYWGEPNVWDEAERQAALVKDKRTKYVFFYPLILLGSAAFIAIGFANITF